MFPLLSADEVSRANPADDDVDQERIVRTNLAEQTGSLQYELSIGSFGLSGDHRRASVSETKNVGDHRFFVFVSSDER